MSEVTPSVAERHNPETIPLDQIDLIRSDIFHNDDYVTLFARLRQEDPVHLQADHPDVGSFWNITRYEDIMHVETNPEIYSSAGTIVVDDMDERFPLPMFIATDPPEHTRYRQAFNPIFAPANLAKFEDLIRERSAAVLDTLPIGETFDWVDRVAVELTTQMLATLFGFP
ncbi:TPA: cytochrome P450, partial [Candidatus Micrarchaeota archaeon]|nr:cytochrome P450 [Candidatus Micrarchaeota archaeon]